MADRTSSRLPVLILTATLVATACSAVGGGETPAFGADVDRPPTPSMDQVQFVDVAAEVGLDFHHSAFQWGTTGDPNAMMGGGLCWIDHDRDGWLDLFVVDTWSDGEWGRWRTEGALPSTRLYRNDRGRFVDVTDDVGARLEVRGSGCVAADLDGDGFTDLFVTTERENVLLWNDDGDRFEIDDGAAGADTYGWHAGTAVGDVNGDGRLDLFVTGYADLNGPLPGATRGFPNTFQAEPDVLLLNQGAIEGQRPQFRNVTADVGVETDGAEYGLGAVFSDVDRDGDLDLYVANDTQPNRLYLNEPASDDLGFRLSEVGATSGVDDDNAGMGIAVGDYDDNGWPDLAVTNLAGQGHAVFRRTLPSPVLDDELPIFESSIDRMGLPELGLDRTGWGISWADVDLDTDLDLLIAQGAIPVTDLDQDREVLQAFENQTAEGDAGSFTEATGELGLDTNGRFIGRGLAAADYDNDGDLDFAVGTIGGPVGLLRNTGAGGHWLVVAFEPATPGTVVTVTMADGVQQQRELMVGTSYLSSADPRAHFGLGTADEVDTVHVRWPNGTEAVQSTVAADQMLTMRPN